MPAKWLPVPRTLTDNRWTKLSSDYRGSPRVRACLVVGIFSMRISCCVDIHPGKQRYRGVCLFMYINMLLWFSAWYLVVYAYVNVIVHFSLKNVVM